MAINFPAYPNPGDTFSSAGIAWVWDGIKWWAAGLIPAYSPGIGDNRIINGDMRIDQRNGGAGGTATGYTLDRWIYGASVAAKGTWWRAAAGAGLIPLGFGNYLEFQSSSAYTAGTTDFFQFRQPIEADMVSDFAWGTASAQPVTLSFWATSSLTGTFSGSITNNSNRSYPFSYSLPVANTWTKIAVTIPGDTAGTWVMSGNALGLDVRFDLGCGANSRGPANAWASTAYSGVTGTTSIVATNGATFLLTGVKLEIGSVATPFNRQSLAKSMADCQRYFVGVGSGAYVSLSVQGYGIGAGYATFIQWSAPVTMRAAPTVSAAWGSVSNANGGAVNVLLNNRTIQSSLTSAADGGYKAVLAVSWLDAEL